jgi:hypothetical protein
MRVCYQLVTAKEQHYATADNGEHQYALKFIEDSPRQDGPFSSERGEQSAAPLDSVIASASIENTTVGFDPAHSRAGEFSLSTR